MSCASCGKQVTAGARYCIHCGAEQSVPTPIAAVAAASMSWRAPPAGRRPMPRRRNLRRATRHAGRVRRAASEPARASTSARVRRRLPLARARQPPPIFPAYAAHPQRRGLAIALAGACVIVAIGALGFIGGHMRRTPVDGADAANESSDHAFGAGCPAACRCGVGYAGTRAGAGCTHCGDRRGDERVIACVGAARSATAGATAGCASGRAGRDQGAAAAVGVARRAARAALPGKPRQRRRPHAGRHGSRASRRPAARGEARRSAQPRPCPGRGPLASDGRRVVALHARGFHHARRMRHSACASAIATATGARCPRAPAIPRPSAGNDQPADAARHRARRCAASHAVGASLHGIPAASRSLAGAPRASTLASCIAAHPRTGIISEG